MPPTHQTSPRALRLRALSFSLALLGGTAQAADDPPRDLTALPFESLVGLEVYSASRFAQRASDAPSTVIVIGASEIRAYGWRTLADVARSVRGLNVNYDRNYSYLGERGFLRPGDYNTRFLLQIDGMRVNDVVYDQAPIGGEFPLDLELIERIEFVPGPGSSVYGSNAFFGIINVVTRRPGVVAGTQAALAAGQAGYRRAQASTGWDDAGGGRWLLSASTTRSTGRDLYFPEFDTPDQNHGVAQGLDHESVKHLYASATYGGLHLTALAAERIKGIPTAAWEQPFNDGRTRTRDAQVQLDLTWNTAVATGVRLDLHAFAARATSNASYVYDSSATLNHDSTVSQWAGLELKAIVRRYPGHKLVTGVDLQRDARMLQQNYDTDPQALYLDDRRQGSRAGVYLQDEWTLRPGLLLNAGLRHDRHSGASGVTSPRVALIAQPSEATTVKLISGTAYRAPNSYEKYYQYIGEGGQLANPALGRERIRSHELALVHEFGDAARLTATVFRNRVDGLITQLIDPQEGLPRFFNVGSASVRGVGLEYEHHFGSGASLRASASRFDASDEIQWPAPARQGSRTPAMRVLPGTQADASQVNSPSTLAKFNAQLPAWRDWRAGLEAQYVGPRRALAGVAGGFTVINLNLVSASLGHGTEVALTATNLLDRRYADPASFEHRQSAIPQDGRTLSVRMAHSF
ncbi:TonB-dependent receptor [Massilia arenosa]|uniref:TonB-dependent receptor n=1 Tax=Zemynaea arenosa TaxID=2561931 RepID=A0A4Y9SJ16_9BURK|nr:TonB-dependent receptor [Massilia arenosa]TFW25972.1 TonB-dependent receptor [Massilia arenosa]